MPEQAAKSVLALAAVNKKWSQLPTSIRDLMAHNLRWANPVAKKLAEKQRRERELFRKFGNAPWSCKPPTGAMSTNPAAKAAANTSPPKPFKFESLATVNNKTLKWTCKACGKETLHKHRLRHARVCKKVPPSKSSERQEKEDRSRGRCFYCHAEDHWVAKCPVKEKRRYL